MNIIKTETTQSSVTLTLEDGRVLNFSLAHDRIYISTSFCDIVEVAKGAMNNASVELSIKEQY